VPLFPLLPMCVDMDLTVFPPFSFRGRNRTEGVLFFVNSDRILPFPPLDPGEIGQGDLQVFPPLTRPWLQSPFFSPPPKTKDNLGGPLPIFFSLTRVPPNFPPPLRPERMFFPFFFFSPFSPTAKALALFPSLPEKR